MAEIRRRWTQGIIHGPECDHCADKIDHAYQDMKFVLGLLPVMADKADWEPIDLGLTYVREPPDEPWEWRLSTSGGREAAGHHESRLTLAVLSGLLECHLADNARCSHVEDAEAVLRHDTHDAGTDSQCLICQPIPRDSEQRVKEILDELRAFGHKLKELDTLPNGHIDSD